RGGGSRRNRQRAGDVGAVRDIDAIEGLIGGADPPQVMAVERAAGRLDTSDRADVSLGWVDGTDEDLGELIGRHGGGRARTARVGRRQRGEGHAAALLHAPTVRGEREQRGPLSVLREQGLSGVAEGGGVENRAVGWIGRGLYRCRGGEAGGRRGRDGV